MIPDWLQSRLARPGAGRVLAWLACLLCVPSLFAGLAADDYFLAQSYTQSRSSAESGFAFSWSTPEAVQAHALPWWTAPDLRAEFFRPLADLSHRIDFQLWPEQVWLMHLHSIALYGLLIVLVARLYSALPGARWVCALATLLFVVDDAHTAVVGWIAARNLVLGMIFAVAALELHIRGARGLSNRSGWAPLCFAAALACNEIMIGMLAYMLAYALTLDDRDRRTRVRGLLPYFAIVGLWLWIRTTWGFGIEGSGLYADPWTHVGDFLRQLLPNLFLLIAGRFGLPLVLDGLAFLPLPQLEGLSSWIAAFVGIAVIALRRWWRSDRVVGFWALGMLGAALPITAGMAQERYLLPLGLGACAILARLLVAIHDGRLQRPGIKFVGWAIVLVHLVAAACLAPVRAAAPVAMRTLTEGLADYAREHEKPVLAVAVHSDLSLMYNDLLLNASSEDSATFASALYAGSQALQVQRVAVNELSIEAEGGWCATPVTRGFSRCRMGVGEVVRTRWFVAHIEAATPDGRPQRVRFEFDCALEACPFAWVDWQSDSPVPFNLPALGGDADAG